MWYAVMVYLLGCIVLGGVLALICQDLDDFSDEGIETTPELVLKTVLLWPVWFVLGLVQTTLWAAIE